MSYGSSIDSLSSALENLESSCNKLTTDSLNSSWDSPAEKKQAEKINSIKEAISSQNNYVKKLIDAMRTIDNYDNYKRTYEYARDSYYSLDRNDKNYFTLSAVASRNMESSATARDRCKISANTSLSSISQRYDTQYDVIEFSDFISTKDEFDNAFAENDSINSGLDLNNTVTRSAADGSYDLSLYHDNSANGFTVTEGNPTFNLSDSDIELLSAIVSAESASNYDDALAVASVIFNRCSASNWVASHGENPVSQATAPNQFVVYQDGIYQQYMNGNAKPEAIAAVRACMDGVRNCDYLSFRSNGSTGFSDNMITPDGNRYK